MSKEKVAFVVVRYGLDVNGGAEYHCRMLAERLTNDYDVEVLTTCVQDYINGGNAVATKKEVINGVLVRRFEAAPIDNVSGKIYERKAKPIRRFRMFLYKIRCLKIVSNFLPIWTCLTVEEEEAIKRSVFYSQELNDFIKANKDVYKAFVAFTIDYAPFYYTALNAGDKAIAIPTLHYTKDSFRALLTKAMAKFAYVGFNTKAELNLGEQLFGKAMKSYGIISVGIEEPQVASWEATKSKYCLPENYLLYIGRVDPGKVGNVFKYFAAYKKKYPQSTLKLVLVGKLYFEKEPYLHPDVIYTGFVSDEEKMAILQHATITINPSRYESLSLILLEALSQGKLMLVNGRCKVLKEHCKQSGYAVDYYMNKRQFVSKLHQMVSLEDLNKQRAERGKRYVIENYNWDLIMERLKHAIRSIS